MSKINNWFNHQYAVAKLTEFIYDDEYFSDPEFFMSGHGSGWGCTYDTYVSNDYEFLPKNYNENGYTNGCGYGYGIGEYSGSVCGNSD